MKAKEENKRKSSLILKRRTIITLKNSQDNFLNPTTIISHTGFF